MLLLVSLTDAPPSQFASLRTACLILRCLWGAGATVAQSFCCLGQMVTTALMRRRARARVEVSALTVRENGRPRPKEMQRKSLFYKDVASTLAHRCRQSAIGSFSILSVIRIADLQYRRIANESAATPLPARPLVVPWAHSNLKV